MAHLPFLCETAAKVEAFPCGHALMASCPPTSFDKLLPDGPFGYSQITDMGDSGQQTWAISQAGLSTLLDLSKKLDLDGEVTPVMAWGMILAHERFEEFTQVDLLRMAGELGRKVRCYG